MHTQFYGISVSTVSPLTAFFRKDSFVSDTMTDRKMVTKPRATWTVNVSLPRRRENKAPNTASRLSRIAAAEALVYFCPKFCSSNVTAVQKTLI